MNRYIIKTDSVEYDEQTNSYKLDLDVKIDDVDFDNGVYIEDIKLYNQNMFVNPTNQSGGISFFDDTLYGEYKDKYKKVDLFKDIEYPTNITTGFFELDNPSVYNDKNHYFLNVGVWTSTLGWQSISSGTYTLKDIYYISDGEYTKVDIQYINNCITNHIDVTKIDYFINTNYVRAFFKENIQDEMLFYKNFNINNDIIIISVKIHPNPDDKCQSDYILKAVYNKRLLLLESMAGVREIADTCTIPRRFIDFILRQKAIDLAQENNDIDLLCKYFKMFSGSIGTNKIEFAPCGCLRS
jgi:hypothetical protein